MYRDYLTPRSPWPAALFSDTLVLAAPVLPPGDEESAIGGLVIQTAWLQLNFVQAGFFVRGGLSLGRFHIRDGLIFGPALVEAYELESKVADHPRVLLGSAAARSQLDATAAYAEPRSSPQCLLLRRDADGHTFIDYLSLLLDEPVDPRPDIAMHRDRIVAQLGAHARNKRVWEKYRWVAEYHNDFIRRRLQDKQLQVPSDAMTWQFSDFV